MMMTQWCCPVCLCQLPGPVADHCSGSQQLLQSSFGCKEPPSQLHPDEIDTEAVLMQALAECEEDDRLDDSAVEIKSDDEFTG